mgnify:CR=1 FL=1
MSKRRQEELNNFLYIQEEKQKETIEELMRKKKNKEREKRIKQNNQKRNDDKFDLETETVIQMTNRNKEKQQEKEKRQAMQLERKRKRRNKKIKSIIKVIMLILIIGGGIVFTMTSPIFNIKDIKVLNNAQVPSETIVSLSGLVTNQNIFRFSSSSIKDKIKENPYIEIVEVHRKIPNTIEIEVQEREHNYNVSYMGKYAYINTQGYILEISEDNKAKPIIYGTSTSEEEISPGKRLNNDDLEKLEDIIKITNIAKENNIYDKITSIDISNKNDYIIYMEQEQKNVHLGDNSNISNKILYVSAILEQEKEHAGDIYVNGDLNNKFQPYFREKLSN